MIKVSGCRECYFFNYNEWGPSACNLNLEDETLTDQVDKHTEDDGPLPASCPLRKGPITVQLKEE